MRLLADENLPGDVVSALRDAGHDVAWIGEMCPGIKDPEVLRRANEASRVVLTSDKGFGELIVRRRSPVAAGVVLLRLSRLSPADLAEAVVTAIGARDDWEGHFAVVTRDRIRMVALK